MDRQFMAYACAAFAGTFIAFPIVIWAMSWGVWAFITLLPWPPR